MNTVHIAERIEEALKPIRDRTDFLPSANEAEADRAKLLAVVDLLLHAMGEMHDSVLLDQDEEDTSLTLDKHEAELLRVLEVLRA